MSTILLYILIVALVADVATTLYSLHLGGREINPFMRRIFGVIAPAPALAATHAALIVFFWLAWPWIQTSVQVLLVLAWWALAGWNIVQIVRQRRANGS